MTFEFACNANGKPYIDKFLGKQPPRIKRMLIERLEIMEKYQLPDLLNSRRLIKMKGIPLHEIRIKFMGVCYRILCIIVNSVCWLLHAFVKKRGDTPQKEINVALTRKKDLETRLNLNNAMTTFVA